MRLGIIPKRIYNRSVQRIIHKYNKDKGAVRGLDCAFLRYGSCELTDERLWEKEIETFVGSLLLKCVTNVSETGKLAVAGRPVGIQAEVIIPVEYDEPRFRRIIDIFTKSVGQYDCFIDDVAATVRNVNLPQINIIIVGEDLQADIGKPGGNGDIILIGRAGTEGSTLLAERYKEKLSSRYNAEYIRRMQNLPLEYQETVNAMIDTDISHMLFPVGEGGLFAALWNLGEHLNTGFDIDLKAIPIYQESVEVSDFFDINPYMLYSGNCILAVTMQSENLISKLLEKNIEATRIGCLTASHDRVIMNNDERRFLTEPEMDEIYRIGR